MRMPELSKIQWSAATPLVAFRDEDIGLHALQGNAASAKGSSYWEDMSRKEALSAMLSEIGGGEARTPDLRVMNPPL